MTAPRPPGPVEPANTYPLGGSAGSSGTAEQVDALKQLYLNASANQAIGPSERVRLAALAHAQMLADGAAASGQHSHRFQAIDRRPDAANRARFNMPLVASLAVACISALLAFQFDRNDLGERMPGVDSAQPQVLPSNSLPNVPTTDAPVEATAPNMNTLPQGLNKQAKARSSEAALTPAMPATLSEETPSARPSAAARTAPIAPPGLPKKAQQADASTGAERGTADVPVRNTTSMARSQSALDPAPLAEASSSPESQALTRMGTPLDAGAGLRLAARTGDVGAVQRVLQTTSPAQLNSTDASGRSALILAAAAGHLRVVQLLVAAGADAAVVDSSGENALQTARRLGLKQIEAALSGP